MQRNALRRAGGATIALVVAACTLVSGGCGENDSTAPSIGNVAGQVTLSGNPVTAGQIMMVSDDGYAATAPLQSDGSFQLVSQYGKGIPLGSYKVAITPKPLEQIPGQELPSGNATDDSGIPAKYHDLNTSGLTAEVKAENAEFQFELQAE